MEILFRELSALEKRLQRGQITEEEHQELKFDVLKKKVVEHEDLLALQKVYLELKARKDKGKVGEFDFEEQRQTLNDEYQKKAVDIQKQYETYYARHLEKMSSPQSRYSILEDLPETSTPVATTEEEVIPRPPAKRFAMKASAQPEPIQPAQVIADDDDDLVTMRRKKPKAVSTGSNMSFLKSAGFRYALYALIVVLAAAIIGIQLFPQLIPQLN